MVQKPFKSIKKRKKKIPIEDLVLSKKAQEQIEKIAKSLIKQIDREVFTRKYAPAAEILKLVGAGAFMAASLAIPTLPLALRPFLRERNEFEVWKRFNIPYLKRTLRRLEKQKLVEIGEEGNIQVVKITDRGCRRLLKYALREITIKKPSFWDGKWRLVSYDIPTSSSGLADVFREYLRDWGFYPLHKSVFLHAYPCEKEIEFLREYLGIGKYVRIFIVTRIENDEPFRTFFGV